jgi:hypothetical protein
MKRWVKRMLVVTAIAAPVAAFAGTGALKDCCGCDCPLAALFQP